MGLRVNRAALDLKGVEDSATLADVIDSQNDTIRFLNFVLKALSFQSNFNGYVAEAVIPATTTVSVQHFLGVTPKWRVILRQEGNGVISDIPSGWNDNFIQLRNNGAETVTISVLIARE